MVPSSTPSGFLMVNMDGVFSTEEMYDAVTDERTRHVDGLAVLLLHQHQVVEAAGAARLDDQRHGCAGCAVDLAEDDGLRQ